MKKKIIFITIESVKRELDSKILLALKAIKKNYKVVIGQKGHLRGMVRHVNPGIMILKSFGPKNTFHIDFIKKNNWKIVSSDEELITAVDYETKINWRMNNENLRKLDIYLAVGEGSDYPIIKKKFSSTLKEIFVCGNLRLELLKKKYREMLDRDSILIKKRFGKFILLLTNFGRINKVVPDYAIDFGLGRIINDNVDIEGKEIFLETQQSEMQRETLYEIIKFIDKFEKNFPEDRIVISPHPNEKIDFWKNYINARRFNNVVINDDVHSSIFPMLNCCDILISNNSTSLLEAYFLGKKAINLLGKKERISEIDILKKISKTVRSSEELNEAIKYLKKNDKTEFIFKEIKEIKNSEENFDAFEKILNKLDHLDGVNAYNSIFKNYKIKIYYFIINKFRIFKNSFKKIINYKNKKNLLIDRLHREKIGTAMQTNFFTKKVKDINTFEKVENLKIKQVVPEVFLLESFDKY
jgi:surface carbohydrate biosynthesis protein